MSKINTSKKTRARKPKKRARAKTQVGEDGWPKRGRPPTYSRSESIAYRTHPKAAQAIRDLAEQDKCTKTDLYNDALADYLLGRGVVIEGWNDDDEDEAHSDFERDLEDQAFEEELWDEA